MKLVTAAQYKEISVRCEVKTAQWPLSTAPTNLSDPLKQCARSRGEEVAAETGRMQCQKGSDTRPAPCQPLSAHLGPLKWIETV